MKENITPLSQYEPGSGSGLYHDSNDPEDLNFELSPQVVYSQWEDSQLGSSKQPSPFPAQETLSSSAQTNHKTSQ